MDGLKRVLPALRQGMNLVDQHEIVDALCSSLCTVRGGSGGSFRSHLCGEGSGLSSRKLSSCCGRKGSGVSGKSSRSFLRGGSREICRSIIRIFNRIHSGNVGRSFCFFFCICGGSSGSGRTGRERKYHTCRNDQAAAFFPCFFHYFFPRMFCCFDMVFF